MHHQHLGGGGRRRGGRVGGHPCRKGLERGGSPAVAAACRSKCSGNGAGGSLRCKAAARAGAATAPSVAADRSRGHTCTCNHSAAAAAASPATSSSSSDGGSKQRPLAPTLSLITKPSGSQQKVSRNTSAICAVYLAFTSPTNPAVKRVWVQRGGVLGPTPLAAAAAAAAAGACNSGSSRKSPVRRR